jgi:hypothetical protein
MYLVSIQSTDTCCFLGFCLIQWRAQEFCSRGVSTNSVEDRGQRERGSEGGSPLVRRSAQFAIE